MLRWEYAELRDILDVTDVRCFGMLLLLVVLSWVAVLLCPRTGPSSTNGLDALEVLGLRSAFPSKGPGAIVSMRFAMFSPPSIRALSGANKGLGWA
jgi:hypothetical protein